MNTKKIHYDVWISLGLFAFIGWVWYQTTLFRQAEETAVYPRILLGVLAGLTVLMLIGGIRKSMSGHEDAIGWKSMKMPLISLAMVAAYEFLFIKLGYFVATPVFLVGLFLYLKQRSWKIIVPVILVYLILVYLVFVLILKVKLI